MDKQELENWMAKYLDGVIIEQEALFVLDYLLESRRNREIFNLAAAGLEGMKQLVQQYEIKDL